MTIGVRYFVEIVGWRLLDDKRLMIYSWSERLDDLHCHLDDDVTVRGHVHFAGIVIEAKSSSSCLVTFVGKVTHLTSSLPAVIKLTRSTYVGK
jgi:hypothetical protein